MAIKILKQLKELIPPATAEEDKELEASIKKNGVRDPLILGPGDVLLDGHRRMQLANKHKAKYQTRIFAGLDTIEKQRDFILDLQLSRRNLTPQQASLLRGRYYNSVKDDHGGNRKDQVPKLGTCSKTAEKVASKAGVSKNTVVRDGKKAEQVDKLSDGLKKAYEGGQLKINANQLGRLSSLEKSEQNAIARQVRVGKQWEQVLPKKVKVAGKKSATKTDPIKTAKSKARKTAEALMRAIDDYNALKPNKTRRGQCHKLWKEMLATLEGWK